MVREPSRSILFNSGESSTVRLCIQGSGARADAASHDHPAAEACPSLPASHIAPHIQTKSREAKVPPHGRHNEVRGFFPTTNLRVLADSSELTDELHRPPASLGSSDLATFQLCTENMEPTAFSVDLGACFIPASSSIAIFSRNFDRIHSSGASQWKKPAQESSERHQKTTKTRTASGLEAPLLHWPPSATRLELAAFKSQSQLALPVTWGVPGPRFCKRHRLAHSLVALLP